MDRKAKILVIDDEEDICHFSKSILEKTGKFEVLTSMSPLQGINLAKMHQPDLILLDVFMPEMDGSKVAEQLLKEEVTRNIPIVFLTALVKENELGSGTGKIGGRRFIPKPVAPQELVSQVKSILNIKD
ncbi:MAG: response regulator [Candidatus Omnitrophota bacterium]